MSKAGALVIFVKTPGCSPIKTRLAKSIGKNLAEEFYDQCLKAMRASAKEIQKKLPGLKIYWAVAEASGLSSPLWTDFPVIYQGEGSLGLRLSNVYREVLNRHGFACFIGADSPHIKSDQMVHGVLETARFLNEKFVMGETSDGGFYFFGGSVQVSEELWTSVEYSAAQTASDLTARLESLGTVIKIESDFDVDTVEDLNRYLEKRFDERNLLPEQASLIHWVRSFSERRDGTGR